ncbi:MAG: LLM class flavin-dependent oxidoreductase [Acidimicrobiia bacterium]
MEIGVSVWLDRPARDCAAVAGAAEAAGFSTLWVPDHYFLRDSFVALALAAESTTTIRLGTAVASPMLRHPALLASSFATLHELSGGRAVAGIGTGGAEFPSQLGLPINHPLAVVRESAEILKALFVGEAQVRGRVFTAAGASLGWIQGGMPVYLAARGPKMLELSGEIADGVITHGLAPSHLDFARARVQEGAARAGRSEDRCELCLMFDYEFDADREAAINRLRDRCMFMVGGSYADELIPLYGLDPDQVLPIRTAVSAGNYREAIEAITPEMVEAFAVGGSEQRLTDQLEVLSAHGVTSVILSLGGRSVDQALTRIERVGRAISK